jgi:glycosyltransferase involved in cell wall biosynthesis
MISILIPVFNRNVVQLVNALHSQLNAVKEDPEIIVMDDGSPDERLKNTNREALNNLNGVRYIELPSNTGRNIIRHTLAAAAKYETLIFLDADSSFPDTLWLQRYMECLTGNDIIMGGRLYATLSPAASSLHFHYGRLREQRAALRRNKSPYRSFLACNFLISKKQLSLLIIDDHLQGYCHEDTFMGLQFEKLNIPITHIDNPVYHEGIDDDLLFMKKQQEALENLQYLYRKYHTGYNFESDVKLIRVYKKIMAVGAGKYILNKLADREAYFKKNTLQSHRLFWLDLWKLAIYHQLSQAQTL